MNKIDNNHPQILAIMELIYWQRMTTSCEHKKNKSYNTFEGFKCFINGGQKEGMESREMKHGGSGGCAACFNRVVKADRPHREGDL